MSRKTLRRCAARGCKLYVNRSRLMCLKHWRLVPTPIKRELNAAYRERGGSPSSVVTQRYADALVAAVNAVTPQITLDAPTPVEPLLATGGTITVDGLDVTTEHGADTDWSKLPPTISGGTAPAEDDGGDCCGVCSGRGGTISGEMQGDPPMTGYIEWFEPCGDCIDKGLCPGCSRPTVPAEVTDGTIAIDDFICSSCGWQFSNDRFYPDEPDDYDDGSSSVDYKLDGYDDGGFGEYQASMRARLDDLEPFDRGYDRWKTDDGYDYTRDDLNFDADRERRSR